MLPSTLDVLKSVLRSDPTLSPVERTSILGRLRQKPDEPKTMSGRTEEVRIVRRVEAARRLSCSMRTIDKLAATGILQRRRLPGRLRASGFLASDIDALILAGGTSQSG